MMFATPRPVRPSAVFQSARVALALFMAVSILDPSHGIAQSSPTPLDYFDFQIGVWQVDGRRADGRGGWHEYEAWLHVERAVVGGWSGIVERWHTRPGDWNRTPDLGSNFRVWDPERELWVTRMLEPPQVEGWQWSPFIWPEISTWVRDETGFAMPARPHNDPISNHVDSAGIVVEDDGSWGIWAARKDEGREQYYLWEEMKATAVSTEHGIWAGLEGGPTGRVETVIASHEGSRALAMDPEGNVYIAAVLPEGPHSGDVSEDIPILKVTPSGQVSTYIEGLVRTAGLSWSQGGLYAKAYDVEGGRLVKIYPDGTVHHIANVRGDPLTTDAEGNAYTVDSNVPQLLRIAPDGTTEVLSRHPELPGALGMAFHEESGTVFVGDWVTGEIHGVRARGPDRGHTWLHATVPGITGNAVAWMATSDEWIYLTGFGQEQVFRVSVEDGHYEWVAGSGLPGHEDGPLGEARFRSPNGIAVTPDGRTIWVSDLGWMRDGVYPEGVLRRILLEEPQ